jgi:hypothetical protein
MNLLRLTSLGSTVFISLVALTAKSVGCGLDWKLPQNHFDGVNEWGNLAYWQKIGDLDLGDGLKVPLNIGFNSAHTSSSPYLGDGWSLAFLEANVVQIDDNHFVMTMPDGRKARFRRQNKTSAPEDEATETLRGGGGWLAQVSQNTFTVWAQCGWKMVFTDGKISSITTPKNQQITYNYKNGIVTEVDKDNAPILNVINDAKGGVSGLSFSGKQIGFEEGDKPNVENIGGQTVIGHVSQSLAKVTLADGTSDNYKFSVDSKLTPTLTVSGLNNRSFAWDPVSKLILKDGDWSYKITPGTQLFANAQVERTKISAPTQKEYYYDDNYQGVLTEQGIDGVKQITQFFVGAGPLKGRTRSVTRVKDGVTTVLRKFDYDETGKMISEVIGGSKSKNITFKYDAQGKQIEIDLNGKLAVKSDFDAQGRLVCKTFSNGIKETYSYLSNGIQQTTHLKDGSTLVARLPGIVTGVAQSAASSMEAAAH